MPASATVWVDTPGGHLTVELMVSAVSEVAVESLSTSPKGVGDRPSPRRALGSIQWSLGFAVVVTVTVASVLTGLALLGQLQASLMKDYWYDKVEVSVFLCSSVPSPVCPAPVSTVERDALASALAADPMVAGVFYESQEEAFARFSDLYAESGLVESVTAEALPESFRVKLVDPEQVGVFIDRYRPWAGVDQVSDQRAALEGFFTLLSGVQTGAVTVALLVAAAAVTLVANTVKLALAARRKEVAIRRLVGATSWQVNRVFLGQTAVLGFVSLVVSAAVLVGFQLWVVEGQLVSRFPFTEFVSWDAVAVVLAVQVVFALGLPLLAAWWTLLRFGHRRMP